MESIIRTEHGQTINDLIHILKAHRPDADVSFVQRAYDFALNAHEGVKRKSGAPYIIHPLATAITLAELSMDEQTIAAGLLHDVPEDTTHSFEEIRHAFGHDVAFLVEGVTKVSRLKYRGIERYMVSLRKMFVAVAQDVRVMIIRFADRIHNLETLDALPPEKRKRIAMESLEIYAPIANRLGMGEMKGKLEDLSFPYIYPEEYEWCEKKILPRLKEKEEFIEKFSTFLKEEFHKRNLSIVAIHTRRKHLFSLYQKLQRNNRDFNRIYDVVALRVIVNSISQCYETLGIIHELCKPLKGRIKDYIAQPKPNGYQSLHTTVFSPSQFAKDPIHTEIVEIQIRTEEMHYEAEYGIAAHWKYKFEEEGERATAHNVRWMQEILNIQNNVTDGQQFLEALKIDVFQNYIFVFTPRGDIIELPEDATPIDFAYKIHSGLGNTCTGTKINEQIASLNTKLKNGDVVEIFSDPHRKSPSPDWLQFVKTNSARGHIRAALNRTQQQLTRGSQY